MNTQDKINKLQDVTIEAFNQSTNLDIVCASVVHIAMASGIGFSEILPLVKTIGKTNGYITDLIDRKEQARLSCEEGLLPSPFSYESLLSWADEVADEYQLTDKVALDIVKASILKRGEQVPRKPQLTGWKLSALDCWTAHEHTQPSAFEVRAYLKQAGLNQSLYTQAYHELFQALVAL